MARWRCCFKVAGALKWFASSFCNSGAPLLGHVSHLVHLRGSG